ncbi:hypothetical protein J6590_050380, partial [Homalodisca vitripennis]
MGHGGLLSTSEAVYCGIPMVLIPMFGDQPNNVAQLAASGAAVKLAYNEITKETVLKALRAVLYDSRYRESAKLLSERFRDRPMSPLDTAVYWTEYVLRHKGARHLRSAGPGIYRSSIDTGIHRRLKDEDETRMRSKVSHVTAAILDHVTAGIYPSLAGIFPSLTGIFPSLAGIFPSLAGIFPSTSHVTAAILDLGDRVWCGGFWEFFPHSQEFFPHSREFPPQLVT